MFRIWIGNLGKYNEGELVGEWVTLPCEDFDKVFERIGISDEPIDGVYYEEIFIADYENDFGYAVGEYDDLDELNEVAEELENLTSDEQEIYEALMDEGFDHDKAVEIIRDCDYTRFEDCMDMSEVAYRWYEETGQLQTLEHYISPSYIDWDAIGRDMEYDGHFIECGTGYIELYR